MILVAMFKCVFKVFVNEMFANKSDAGFCVAMLDGEGEKYVKKLDDSLGGHPAWS